MLGIIMLCISVILVTLVVTQVLLPAFKGSLLFPLFRKNIRKAESNLTLKETRKRIKEMEVQALRLEHEGQQDMHDALDEIIESDETNKKEKV